MIAEELAGRGWAGVAELYDEILVYGDPVLCDHQAEYGLPIEPRYCGWVAEAGAPVRRREENLLVVTGGGAVRRLGAGLRPVLVPRRSPRREQAMRASRLAALGVADVVDENVPAEEVAWLLEPFRLLPPDALAETGIGLDGAHRAAAAIGALAGAELQ